MEVILTDTIRPDGMLCWSKNVGPDGVVRIVGAPFRCIVMGGRDDVLLQVVRVVGGGCACFDTPS